LAIGLSIGATIASFVALIGREFCGLRYVGARLSMTLVAIASFCGNALGNAVGLGTLSGGAIRYRIYRSVGLSPEAVGGVIAFTSLGSAIDLVLFAALSAIAAAPAIAALYHVPTIAIEATAWPILAATVLLIVVFSMRRKALRVRGFLLPFPAPRLFLAQLVFTGLDVVAAAASLWVLLPAARLELLRSSRSSRRRRGSASSAPSPAVSASSMPSCSPHCPNRFRPTRWLPRCWLIAAFTSCCR
jgi:phosphatidylglycerol lysyltransferase